MSAESPPAVTEGRSPVDVGPGGGSLPGDVPALVLSWDGGGRCVSVRADVPDPGSAWPELCGDGWLALLHPGDRRRAAERLRAVLAGEGDREESLRLAGGDRWAILRIHAVPPPPGTPAASARASGVLVDATRSLGSSAGMVRLVEGFNRLRQPAEVVRAMLDEGLEIVGGRTAVLHVLADTGDAIEVAGSAGVPEDVVEERFGRIPLSSPLPSAEVLRTGQTVVVSSDDERRERYPSLEGMEINYDPAFVVMPLNDAVGRPFGSLGVGFADGARFGGRDLDFLQDVAAQCALALDRARLADATVRDQEHLAFLDELSGVLSSSLEMGTTLTRLAEMTVPRIADWCVVRLAVSAADPRPPIGAAHVEQGRVDHLVRLALHLPRELARMGELGEALANNRPLIRNSRGGEMLRSLFGGDADRGLLAELGVDGVAIFPLQARGRLVGALGFGNGPGRTFAAADVELAKAVASRAAVIVDNARLFHQQSGVARALQDSLLPGSLPSIPGIELGARYRAAGQGFDVGGDFYDAFQADANWWIVAVGDVCGHGVEAAATTGLVRHTIRSAAMGGVMPSAVLTHLNEMLLRAGAERDARDDDRVPVSPGFCTVLVGAVQPTDRGVDIILCAGGHPLPLVRRTGGRVEPVGVPGTLLGVTRELRLSDSVVHLDPGEVMVCYTDGLADRRSGRRTFGEEGIVKAIYQGMGMTADNQARLIESEAVAFVDEEPTDDMAVLVLRSRPAAPPA
jgi:serine phosphatase RsbU (regulator of sigma subunit)